MVGAPALEAYRGAQTPRTPGAADKLVRAMLGPARAEATQILSRPLERDRSVGGLPKPR